MSENAIQPPLETEEKPQAMIYDGWGFVPLPTADTDAPERETVVKIPA